MITFPVLIALGLNPVMANATNTVGIWSGSLGSMWGFRKELGGVPRRMFWLLVPAFVGGLAGALVGMGLPEDEAKRYVSHIGGGKTLVVVHCDTLQEVAKAKAALARTGAEDVSASGEHNAAVAAAVSP